MFAYDLLGCGRLPFANEIAPAKLFGGNAHSACDFIHMAFEREDALRRAETAKCAVRRMICRHSAAANAYVRAIVWPGSMNRSPRQHDRRERGIGAAIDREINLHSEQLSFFVDCRAMARA